MKEGRDSASEGGRSALQWMLLVGVLTFFLLPFMQLWSVEAVPMFLSDSYRQAAVAAENLMAEAQAHPFNESVPPSAFHPLKAGEDLGLEGRVEVSPHPDMAGMTLIRVQVRWGWLLFRKTLTLESAITQTRP